MYVKEMLLYDDIKNYKSMGQIDKNIINWIICVTNGHSLLFNPYELREWMDNYLYIKLLNNQLTILECAEEIQKKAEELYNY
jgi:hypothetical protein